MMTHLLAALFGYVVGMAAMWAALSGRGWWSPKGDASSPGWWKASLRPLTDTERDELAAAYPGRSARVDDDRERGRSRDRHHDQRAPLPPQQTL